MLLRLVLLCAACSRAPSPRAEIWLGGDLHLGADGDPLAPLAPLVAGRVGIVNLEGPVGAGAATVDRLVNPPSTPARLAAAGIIVAGIANNHSGDLGPGGLPATAAALAAAGVLPAGGAVGPAHVVIGGLRVVVTAHDLTGGVPDGLADELRAARRRGDVLVATFHVTGPPSYLPRPELRAAVEIAVSADAAVIAAHGTHTIARVERRGTRVIAWGLGNLAFACDCTDESDAILLGLTLTRDGVVAAEVIPIDAGLRGNPARPAADAPLLYDLLRSLGSSPLDRHGARAGL